jgi:hypothetical protein
MALMNGRVNRYPEIGKFSTARCVDAPHNALAGTVIGPIESFSIRVASGMTILPSQRIVSKKQRRNEIR